MIIYDQIISSSDITQFERFFKKIYFLKTDLAVPKKFLKSSKEKQNSDKEIITGVCLKRFKVKPVKITPYELSSLHRVYKVISDRKIYVFRINALPELFKEFHFFQDIWAMEKLKEKKLPFLKIYLVDVSRKKYTSDFEVLEETKGISLHELWKTNHISPNHIFNFGKLVANIHKIKTSEFGPFHIRSLINNSAQGVYNTWREYFLKNLEQHLSLCYKYKIITSGGVKRIRTLLLTEKYNLLHPVLLHGDLANHNVFARNGKITALIDWEDSISGDPVYDMAFYITGIYENLNLSSSFIRGYASVSELPPDFDNKFWLYFLRISLCKAIIRHNSKTANSKSLPSIKKRINFALSKIEKLK